MCRSPAMASRGTFRPSNLSTLSHQRIRVLGQPDQECRIAHDGDSVDQAGVGGGSEWNLKG